MNRKLLQTGVYNDYVDQDYGIFIIFIKTALKIQEIEFQSLRNPWTPLEVSHSFGNYLWDLLDRPLLGLEMSSSSFSAHHYHLSVFIILGRNQQPTFLNKLVLFQHQ